MGGDHSMRDYGIAAPHGPNRTGDHVTTADILNEAVMNQNESEVFKSLLLPDDSYDEAGTYWADMPIWQRIKFVNKVDSAEAKKELKAIGRMIKEDPLSPIGYYMRNMVIPGAGLLLEGYVLIVSHELPDDLLTALQLRSVLHRKRQASPRLCLPQLLGLIHCLQRNLGPVDRISRNHWYHCRSNPRRYHR